MADKVDRNVEQDPQVGDVVQPIPALTDAPLSATLTVIAVARNAVYWKRAGRFGKTPLSFWNGMRVQSGPRLRLVLTALAALEQQP